MWQSCTQLDRVALFRPLRWPQSFKHGDIHVVHYYLSYIPLDLFLQLAYLSNECQAFYNTLLSFQICRKADCLEAAKWAVVSPQQRFLWGGWTMGTEAKCLSPPFSKGCSSSHLLVINLSDLAIKATEMIWQKRNKNNFTGAFVVQLPQSPTQDLSFSVGWGSWAILLHGTWWSYADMWAWPKFRGTSEGWGRMFSL